MNSLLTWNDWLARWLPWLFSEECVRIGPIPKGTPVNLLTNIDLECGKIDLARLLFKMKADLKEVEGKSEQEAMQFLRILCPTSCRSANVRILSSTGALLRHELFKRRDRR